jgi:hypothetical protein
LAKRKKHFRGNIRDFQCLLKFFSCLPYLETLAFIAETKVASRKAKIFPTNLETFDETLFLRLLTLVRHAPKHW